MPPPSYHAREATYTSSSPRAIPTARSLWPWICPTRP